ncbi:MAG: hypothetical protein WCW27_06065 [Patescibacteria group bacterium]|jgi:hypothetical protein
MDNDETLTPLVTRGAERKPFKKRASIKRCAQNRKTLKKGKEGKKVSVRGRGQLHVARMGLTLNRSDEKNVLSRERDNLIFESGLEHYCFFLRSTVVRDWPTFEKTTWQAPDPAKVVYG